ncbi:MAG: hypothetical protein IJF37_04215 [Lachnospiraceae bacterium]|nr:hypothetical protein [Lachnospiraceae bacterium]
MAVSKIGSTTTVYRSTSTTRVSSTSPSSSTTSTSRTKSTVSSASTTSRTISYSSATAKATSSTTVTYSGSSSTAKVSSTTSTRTTATKSNKVSVSASTTASTTAKASSTTAKVASASNTSKVSMTVASVSNTSKASISVSSTTANISSSTTVPTYAYLAHLGDCGQLDVENALVKLGYDDTQDGDFIDSLEKFKNNAKMSTYSVYSYEVIEKLSNLYESVLSTTGSGITGPGSSSDIVVEGDKYVGLTGSSLFCNISSDYFGFSSMESYAMYSLYEGLVKNYGQYAEYQFVRTIASCCEGYGDSNLFQIAAGLMSSDYVPNFMIKNGLSEKNAELLIKAIQNQNLVTSTDKDSFANIIYKQSKIEDCTIKQQNRINELYTQFQGKLDFGHMCATLACYLYKGNTVIADVGVKLFTDGLTLEEAAGYGGDIFGVGLIGNGEPSMNNSDYMADLDAINIKKRYSTTNSIMDVVLEYYSDLKNNKINRADEFVNNLGGQDGLEDLKNKIKDYESSESNDATVAWSFYDSLVNSSNTLIED